MTDHPLRRRDLLALGAVAPFLSGRSQAPTSPPHGTDAMPKAAERRKELYALMGKLPDRQRPHAVAALGQPVQAGAIENLCFTESVLQMYSTIQSAVWSLNSL